MIWIELTIPNSIDCYSPTILINAQSICRMRQFRENDTDITQLHFSGYGMVTEFVKETPKEIIQKICDKYPFTDPRSRGIG